MEERIVYLLGAGASAQKMPAVADFNAYFDFTISRLRGYIAKHIHNQEFVDGKDLELRETIGDQKLSNHIERFYNLLVSIQKESAEYSSIDTLAKKYFFQSHPDKDSINRIIACLILEHQVAHGLDKRYEAFLAAILEIHSRSIRFPSNLDVYSWNYDLQFEEAVYRIKKDLFRNSFTHFFTNDDKPSAAYNGFYYRKLNGIAGHNYLFDVNNRSLNLSEIQQWREVLKASEPKSYALNHYIKTSDAGVTEIAFAWEKDISQLRKQMQKLIYAKTLVIIGYSFPTFNSQVDELFFELGNFANIFIQCGAKGEEVSDRVIELWEKHKYKNGRVSVEPKIKILSRIDEFHIPKSFNFNYNTEE